MTITFIGHGYVGLVTACVFADFGNDVWVIGHTKEKIERLKNNDPIIYEPGLKEMLEKNNKANRLHFTLDYSEAIAKSDIVFIAVGTPPKSTGEADLSTVLHVADSITPHLKKGFTVVSCKSTVPIGTNKMIYDRISQKLPKGVTIAVASCPEFLREGSALSDTLSPDRVVVGSNSKEAIEKLLQLHEPIQGKKIVTDLASAELIKYTSNAILATKISFANLIAFFCEKTGADVETVLDAVGIDKRIGRIFLNPGVGYGGSCFPKDVKALITIGQGLGIDVGLLKEVEHINQEAKDTFVKKISAEFKGKKLAVWGLSFKPNTDDIRDAPSLYIIDQLIQKGVQIVAYDPAAMNNVKKKYDQSITFVNDPYAAVKDADALCIFTEWNEFKQVDLTKVKSLLKNPFVFDGRNIYDPQTMKNFGFRYISVGRTS